MSQLIAMVLVIWREKALLILDPWESKPHPTQFPHLVPPVRWPSADVNGFASIHHEKFQVEDKFQKRKALIRVLLFS